MFGQVAKQGMHLAVLDQQGGRLQGVKTRIAGPVAGGSDVLHVYAIHLAELPEEQGDQVVGGQLDNQLVDGPPGATLQDLDSREVAAHGADPAGYGTQRARTVR